MNFFKKASVLMLTIFMLAITFIQPQIVSAAEGGVSLGTSGMLSRRLINSTGISGVTKYAKDGKSFNFRYVTNFAMSISRAPLVYNVSIDPGLAPYVDHISVTGVGSRRGKFDVEASLPGEFYFTLRDTLIRTLSSIDITVYLKNDIKKLPYSKYAYSVAMLEPNLGFQYILKTRATGVAEANPNTFNMGSNIISSIAGINSSLNHSYIGYTEGTVVEGDKLVDIEYNVYEKCYPFIRRNDLVFCFDSMLARFIDRVDVYNEVTGRFIQSLSMTNSGQVKIPVAKVDSMISMSMFASFWPINLKAHFKDGVTFSDVTPGTYTISAYAESSPLLNLGRPQILQSSLCTMGVYKADTHEIKIPDLPDFDIPDLSDFDITELPDGLLEYFK